MKHHKILIFLLFSIIAACVFLLQDNRRDNNVHAQNVTSRDAIAIRVIPNPSHYSAQHWYGEQNFSGSPQSITVDGYEAVRDGRTVYVNVANSNSVDLWTNIYLISYNQEAEDVTVDIFGQILSHWNFNTNVSYEGNCRENTTIPCRQDEECPIGDVCDSMKARIARDTRRLGDLTEIKSFMDSYAVIGHYPILGAGTYLPNKTMSVWPSWQETLASELGGRLPVDPANKLGGCPGYNEITCWDENSKLFADPDPGNGVFDLPDESLAYYYNTDNTGGTAYICAVFETSLDIQGDPPCIITGVCLDFDEDGYGNPASSDCDDPALDCDDTNDRRNEGIPEAGNCNDGIDNDCDGFADCYDADCFGGNCAITCSDNICNGSCGAGCNAAQDPDCASGGCCGDGVCQDPSECSSGIRPCYGPGLDCECGNNDIECGEACDGGVDCSPVCILLSSCVDIDGDGYDTCDPGDPGAIDANIADCDDNPGQCGDQCFPGNPAGEACDDYDHDCAGGAYDGLEPDDCEYFCLSLGHNYSISRDPGRECCGDDQPDEGILGISQEFPEASCGDNIDNDCDNTCDDVLNACYGASLEDPDCTGNCNDSGEHDWTTMANPGTCYQCDFEGDQDIDEQDGQIYPFGKADDCDADCNVVNITVEISDYEDGSELTCNDGLDNDCDGDFDCNDTTDCACALPAVCNFVTGVCEAACTNNDGDGYSFEGGGDCCAGPCGAAADCDDGDANQYPGAVESCSGEDDDCDGLIDESWAPVGNDNQYGVCAGSYKNCVGGVLENDYSGVPGYEGLVEQTCDGLDNNCDNTVDEGFDFEDCREVCEDGTGYTWTDNGGILNCCGNDLNEGNPYQANEFTCDDLNDNDCDGLLNCADFVDCALDPACAGGGENCFVVGDEDGDGCADAADSECGGTETDCSDGIDNNCNGDFDCNDAADCACVLPAVCNTVTGACEAACASNGCNGDCPTGCTGNDDPDCPGVCLDCTCDLDIDCANTCAAGDGCCNGCPIPDTDCAGVNNCVFPFIFPCVL